VIELMRQNGYITDADASRAKAYPLQLANKNVGAGRPRRTSWNGFDSS
jgi:membrane peptidoglycan carboxypeptidase